MSVQCMTCGRSRPFLARGTTGGWGGRADALLDHLVDSAKTIAGLKSLATIQRSQRALVRSFLTDSLQLADGIRLRHGDGSGDRGCGSGVIGVAKGAAFAWSQ